jgi:diguanylate cyclase (GGDEF)-like protein
MNTLTTTVTSAPGRSGHQAGTPILVAGLESGSGERIAKLLAGTQYRIVVMSSLDEVIREMAAQEYAVILCTIGSAAASEIQRLAVLRAQKINAVTPMILVAPGPIDQASVMRTLGAGVVDCIQQPADEFVLRAKVKMFVDMYRNSQRLRAVESQSADILTDGLTGLPNRLIFVDRADQAMRQAARSGSRVAVAVMDIDQVEDVRQTLGPMSGEELLRQIALRLTGSLRRSDTVARIGDSTFAVILACDTRDGIATVTTRLDRVMSDGFVVGGHRITLGGGIGVALFPEHGRDAQALIDCANAVMVIAKQNSLGHLFYDSIQRAQMDEPAQSAEMNAEELFRVSAA